MNTASNFVCQAPMAPGSLFFFSFPQESMSDSQNEHFNPRPNSMFLSIDQNLCKINYSICYIFLVSAKFWFFSV